MAYTEDDMLMLSGIQHYMFCPRQWALIHLEQLWDENRLTAEGQLLHQRVDDPFCRQKNGDTITLRSVHIASLSLGLYGMTDAVELLPSNTPENSTLLPSYQGYWQLYPIEYKRGHSKPDERDEVQLCAQVICLEEMYNVEIDHAALYYGETRHRESISIDAKLRKLTYQCAHAMHRLFDKGITPKAQKIPGCRNCSLINQCMPELSECSQVGHYLKKNLYEEIT